DYYCQSADRSGNRYIF
nr:immunoglobulin light chain junction region [Macaca mulatta]MOX30106.1 immunoglobulin light chain junction region [Macaca mulatta]